MIVVKIEMWPGGDRSRVRLLGLMTIANDGTGTETRGNYDITAAKATLFQSRIIQESTALQPKDFHFSRIERWPRQGLTVYRLVKKALTVLFPERKRGRK